MPRLSQPNPNRVSKQQQEQDGTTFVVNAGQGVVYSGGILNANVDNSTLEVNPSNNQLRVKAGGPYLPPGVIFPYAGTALPTGYLWCDGISYNITIYPELVSLKNAIGYAHGGSGNSFRVPDYRGRFLRGVDGSAGNDPDKVSRTAMNTGGNTGNAVGSVQAVATKLPNTAFSIATSQGSHGHTVSASGSGWTGNVTGSGAAWTHNHAVAGQDNTGTNGFVPETGNNWWATTSNADLQHTHSFSVSVSGSATSAGMHGHNIDGGGDNETRPINAYVNYIIKI